MARMIFNAHTPPTLISRRRFALVASGTALIGISGCSDSDEQDTSSNKLLLQRFTASSSNASMVLGNGGSDSFAIWLEPATGNLQQALFTNAGRKYRVFYGADNQVTGAREEISGDMLIVSTISNERKDYNLYDKSGAWKSGWAVISGEGGSISGAQILSSPAVVAGRPAPGTLGARKVLFKTTALLVQSRGTSLVARMIDMVISSAHAQSTSGSFGQAVAGAFIATAGAVVISGATTAATALIGAAAVATGVYVAGSAISNSQSINFDTIKNQVDSIINSDVGKSLGDSLSNWANQKDPISNLSSRISDYIDKGSDSLSGAPSLGSVAAGMQNTAVAAASGLISAADNLLASLNSGGAPTPPNPSPTNPNPTNPGDTFVVPFYCSPAPC